MEFQFTEEQAMIAETAKAFFAEQATSARTRAAMAADGLDRALWAGFCQDLGLGGVALPEALGGAGLGMVEFACVAEAAGAQVAALPMLSLATAAQAIAHGGSDVQKEKWLPRLIAGDAVATMAWEAPVSATAGRLTGTVSFLPHGGVADLALLGVGQECWVVETAAAGVKVTAHTTMDQTRPMATITLDSVPAERLMDGAAALEAARRGGWLCLAAEALGGAQVSLDRTIVYSQERKQFGRQIGSFQAYKHRLADMLIEIEQARSAVYWAACAIDEGAEDATLALHAAKSFAADTFFMCAGNMIQLHGGIGFTWEHDAHLFFKRARSIQTMYGNGNWHREQVAAQILEAAQ